jgi:hypothetical protein
MDFITWIYDMNRQDLSFYEARTDHPKGGKVRAVKYSQLNNEEKSYLSKQANLSLLNFIDPAMYAFSYFKVGDAKGSFNFRHYLTPFGSMQNLNLLYKKTDLGLYLTLTRAENLNNSYYGISTEIVNTPIINNKFALNAKISMLSQPKDLEFKTKSSQMTYFAKVGLSYKLLKDVSTNLNVIHKTDGFVPAIASLKKTTYTELDITFKF